MLNYPVYFLEQVLSEELPGTIGKILFPKSMRWNSEVCTVIPTYLISVSIEVLLVDAICKFMEVFLVDTICYNGSVPGLFSIIALFYTGLKS